MSKQTDLGCNIDQQREDDIKDDITADKIIFSSCFNKTILTHSFQFA